MAVGGPPQLRSPPIAIAVVSGRLRSRSTVTFEHPAINEPTIIKKVPILNNFDKSTVNLDVTTMLTICSNLTHRGEKYDWESSSFKFINVQAMDERVNHVLRDVDEWLLNMLTF